MYILFNIGVLGLTLLIAYWWANQGVFSAILHLVCVIVAGAIAFGVWEPLVVGLMLRGSWFDSYAWGFGLIIPFAVSLFLLRFAIDKLAPANVDLPHWANLTFGFPIGLGAGILTMGIVIIGCGFMQSHMAIMGYRGYGPNKEGKIVKYNQAMWLPVHELTSGFFSVTSGSSMWTPHGMNRTNPSLHKQSSLVRNSSRDGKGQVTLPPKEARVTRFMFGEAEQAAAVEMRFEAGAMDFGEQLTISASQIRLIARTSGFRSAKTVHPSGWSQNGEMYLFDDASHYIVSTPGQESADAMILFELPLGFVPSYIQVKGVRFRLPQPEALPAGPFEMLSANSSSDPVGADVDLTATPIGGDAITVSNSIRPIRISSNRLPGSIDEKDQYLVDGIAEFVTGQQEMISRQLIIKGVYESPGTRCVMLNVSRDSPASVYSKEVRAAASESDRLALVDSEGNTYSPLGYIHKKGRGKPVGIKLAPGKFVRTLAELPHLPTSGDQELQLYFRVTKGANIVAFKIGDKTIGTCNLTVPST